VDKNEDDFFLNETLKQIAVSADIKKNQAFLG
jgi:hypothetical protein